MSDGVGWPPRCYLPDGDGPWPAVLEALPYRKDDDTAAYRPSTSGWPPPATWCAASTSGEPGSSEGIAEDEYPPSNAPTC